MCKLTLAKIDRHTEAVDELDVEGILAFAERVLPRAADLWVQASLEQRQRFQQLFFPDGIRFDGKRLVGTGTTLPVFNYLNPISDAKKDLVDQIFTSWNQMAGWMKRLEDLKRSAS